MFFLRRTEGRNYGFGTLPSDLQSRLPAHSRGQREKIENFSCLGLGVNALYFGNASVRWPARS